MTSEVMGSVMNESYDRCVTATASHASATPFGVLLREWRAARRVASRRVSQLDLSLDAGVSSRHLSCVETGKSQPSRELVSRLADTLDLPVRERNALLVAAGYAPEFPETTLEAPELAQVRRAIDFILEHQEPYPAFVLNRRWDVLLANRAAERIANFLIGGSAHANMVRQFFDPNDMRATVTNWEEVAGDLIRHLHEEIAAARLLITSRTAELRAACGPVDLSPRRSAPTPASRWRARDRSRAASCRSLCATASCTCRSPRHSR